MRVDASFHVIQKGMGRLQGRDRVGIARTVAPMEVREIAMSDVDLWVPSTERRSGYVVTEGALWVSPSTYRSDPATAAELLEWLSMGRGREVISQAMHLSPFAVEFWVHRKFGGINPGSERSGDYEAAAVAAAGYLDANVRVADGLALFRTLGPMLALKGSQWDVEEHVNRLNPLTHPWARLDRVRADPTAGMYRDCEQFHPRDEVDRAGREERLAEWLDLYDGVPAELAGDGDVTLLANVLPEQVATILDEYAPHVRGPGASKQLGDRRRALLDLRVRGALGGVRRDEAADVLAQVGENLRYVASIHPQVHRQAAVFVSRRNPCNIRQVERILARIDEALPRALAIDADDLDAMAAIGP